MSRVARPAPPPPPVRRGQVQAFEALCNYKAQRDCELTFEEGDLLFVLDRTDPNWWLATIDNKKGLIPSKHVSSDSAKMAIIDAARRGNLQLMEECLAAGMSVNALDKSGSSSLHAASQGGHIDCVLRLLQDPKLEINLQNKIGDTPLHCAAYRGHAEVVQLLLKHGASRDLLNREKVTARTLAKRGTIIALLEEERDSANAKLSFDDQEYGAADSEDSD